MKNGKILGFLKYSICSFGVSYTLISLIYTINYYIAFAVFKKRLTNNMIDIENFNANRLAEFQDSFYQLFFSTIFDPITTYLYLALISTVIILLIKFLLYLLGKNKLFGNKSKITKNDLARIPRPMLYRHIILISLIYLIIFVAFGFNIPNAYQLENGFGLCDWKFPCKLFVPIMIFFVFTLYIKLGELVPVAKVKKQKQTTKKTISKASKKDE